MHDVTKEHRFACDLDVHVGELLLVTAVDEHTAVRPERRELRLFS